MSQARSLAPKSGLRAAVKRTVIIECPSCHTKFGLDSSSVDGVDFPRFHCSRCDHVFAQNESLSADVALDNGGVSAAGATAQETSEGREDYRSRLHTSAVSNEKLSNEELSYEDPSADLPNEVVGSSSPESTMDVWSNVIPQSSKATSTQASTRSTDFSGLNQFDDAADVVSSIETEPFAAAAPTTKFAAGATDTTEGGRSLVIPRSISHTGSAPREAEEQLDFPFPAKTLSSAKESETAAGVAQAKSAAPVINGSDRSLERYRAETRSPSLQKPSQLLADLLKAPTPPIASTEQMPETRRHRWSAGLWIIAPTLGFLVLLGTFGAFLSTGTPAAQNAISSLMPSALQAPPGGLYITSTSFRRVPLDNGEVVAVVSGRVRNDSTSAVKKVLLEAIALDARGQPVSSARADLRSDLSGAQLTALSRDSIAELQARERTTGVKLLPGESHDFAVAVTSGNLANAKFYSARIYAAQ